jgi:hypothetical protein
MLSAAFGHKPICQAENAATRGAFSIQQRGRRAKRLLKLGETQ